MDMEKVARWAFIAFVIIAIVMGLVIGSWAYNATGLLPTTSHWNDPDVSNANAYVTLVLLILGIIVGLISIAAKEVTPFLIATTALIVASSILNVWTPLTKIHELLYYWATAILSYIVAFAAPAAVIIAIKEVFAMTRSKQP
jgi:FtsH-binding integral membrane protein